MSPSSLLNVSPDLMRQRSQFGLAESPMTAGCDRRWAIGLGVALVAVTVLLFLALR